jgi:uncharacterized protein involved in response to NO
MNTPKIFNYPLFALGFRPFFILAGFSALLLMLIWNAVLHGAFSASHYFPGTLWHSHEMLMGYTSAVIAGFLLTAVRNWTGIDTITGDKLAGLSLLWLYGRIVPFYSDNLPGILIALIDFAFLPALAYFLITPILKSKNYRNLFFIAFLLLLAFGNSLIHAEILGFSLTTSKIGLQLILATIIVMILVVAGRVFPFFTERGLPGTLSIRSPQMDALAIGSTVLFFVLLISGISEFWLALIAITAALLNGIRVSGWYVHRIWYVPLLWILYMGYAWIILGFILSAFSAYSVVTPDIALHAFTLGGIGIMTLGMMARVALGHTGRSLKATRVIATAFILLNVCAFIRILLPIPLQNNLSLLIYLATLTWLATFAIFTSYYFPILTSKRPDGNEG